ncbi:hypothetical protein [Hazenella coriacea]|uniref:Glycosyl transferase family 2 n=1 Tax=Hazenella coriacea TaxID=1179467 RepID=A0A4R3L7A1_9BACL|nr:hypothetical protein [Hazenella coriacea]TCS95643.1 hypothetical protein EDD58_102218 [Hazenella coriacea]
MEQWIFWGAALYVAMFFLVKFLSKYFGNYYHNKAYHLVMITHNSQQSIEWMIRSYHFWNVTKGKYRKNSLLTCIDLGSTDDTLVILQRLQHRYPQLQIIKMSPFPSEDEAIQQWLLSQKQNKEKLIVLDLRLGDIEKESERFLA